MMDHSDELSAALPCHGCGYDLRAHPPDGKCPECGASVAEARRAAAIPRRPSWGASDARWRRRMLLGVWLLAFLPLMDVLSAYELASRISVPAVWEVGTNFHTLDDSFLASMRVYQMAMFCMGVVLLFSRERGRRRGALDWSRRWGVLCSYVVALLAAAQVLLIGALVMAGVASVFLSMPWKYQPAVTRSFANLGAAYLRYGPVPKDAAFAVLVVFSSIAMLLACISLFEALRSSASKYVAAILLAPLAWFSIMNLVRAGGYCLGSSRVDVLDLYWLAGYFRPELLVSRVTGQMAGYYSDPSGSGFIAEAVKWCAIAAIAVWLTIAQARAWRRRRRGAAA